MTCRDAAPRPRNGVVVAGMGLVTALGADRESTWRALLDGRSGARVVDVDRLGPRAAFPALDPLVRARLPEPAHTLAVRAATEALVDAGLMNPGPAGTANGLRDHVDPDRVGVIVGLSKGGLRGLTRSAARTFEQRDLAPFDCDWTLSWPHAAADFVAVMTGATGPRSCPVAACATGLVAALRGLEWIERGVCDVVLVGAADASLEPLVLAAFDRMRVLARGHNLDDPTCLVRPGDRTRNGFLAGEGAAILVLERAAHAQARSIQPYCAFAGGALGSDPHGVADPDPDPRQLARFLERAVAQSDSDMNMIDHVNLHATATRAGDPPECAAVRRALGTRADETPCVANKAQIGHLLGAAGAAELAIACLTLRDDAVPPTLNRDDPDPACDLLFMRATHRQPIRAALKVSIGFGGHLAAAVLAQSESARRPAPFERSELEP